MKWRFRVIAVLILFVCMGCISESSQEEVQPNILILYADDLGWNDISSPNASLGYGSQNHQTPHIDRLAEQGMSFTRAYTQQNCAPTRASMLTGQYTPTHGVYNVWSLARYGKGVTKENTRIIPPEQHDDILTSTITFAETLKEVGYTNYIFGKVHGWSGDLNKDHGFDVDYSVTRAIPNLKNSSYIPTKDTTGAWTFADPKFKAYAAPYTKSYINENLMPHARGNNPMQLIGTPKHLTDAITDAVVDELTKTKKNVPFCMWVSYHAIHSKIVGRKDLNEKYENRLLLDDRHQNIEYAALTEQLDQSVGRILNELDELGLDKNTIVVFTSDNGGVHKKHSNDPLRGAKGMYYDGGIRVPMIVKWPGKVKAGKTSNEPIHVIDFYPSFAELANANLPLKEVHALAGESFIPLLLGKRQQMERDKLFWHFPGYMDFRQEPNTVMMKRVNNQWYKMRYSYETDTYELYNLDKDLSEKDNLLKQPILAIHKNMAKVMVKDMQEWLAEVQPAVMHYKSDGSEVGFPPARF